MATVHRAKEHGIEGFERIVAIKRLLPHLAEDASFVRSFVREAKLASMLQHINIVQLYELGRVGQVLFISMEYIEGRDVRNLLRQARRVAGPPPLPVFLSLMIQLCDALEYAHERTDENGEPLGLVHRDVSPSNLLVTHGGHLKVIDFGIAKAQSAHLRTNTGRVKGKLAYMAPEALRAQSPDARSDIFSAGVIAHELLTARPLFACKNEYQTILRVQQADVAPPSTFNPGCPPELDRLVLGALARDPDDRWASAAEWRDALEDYRAHLGVRATHREVSSWVEWAFATDAPATGTFPAVAPGTGSHRTPTKTNARVRGSTVPPVPSPRPPPPPAPSSSSSSSSSIVSGPISSIDISVDEMELVFPSPAAVVSLPPVPMPASRALGADAEEAAAEFAWGGEELESRAEPAVLDDIPDVSMKFEAVGRAGGARGHGHLDRAPSSSLGFGAGIIETHRSRRRRGLIAGVLAITLTCAGVGYGFMQWRDQPAADQPAAAFGSAMLKFDIEPNDVSIDVQGYDRHDGSPFELEVDAPGTYQVEIHRPGYKSYVSAMEVDADRVYVVQMALDRGASDKASLVVRSSPSGQRVTIDGTPLEERTPVAYEVGPGAHVISIHGHDGEELWRHELVAAGNTHYELHPTLQQQAAAVPGAHRSERRRRRGDAAGSSDSRRASRRQAFALQAIEPRASGSAEATITARPTSVLDSLALTAPPPVQRPAPTGRPDPGTDPVTISPTELRKLSGDLPALSFSTGADSLPRRISAKLCIDTRGVVDSVTLLTDVPRRARLELRRAFQSWRYTPYAEQGVVRPACFGVAFRIDDSGR